MFQTFLAALLGTTIVKIAVTLVHCWPWAEPHPRHMPGVLLLNPHDNPLIIVYNFLPCRWETQGWKTRVAEKKIVVI